MSEMDNIMRMEAERTGHYGADYEDCADFDAELPACDICGATDYEFAVKDKMGHTDGCSNCRTIEKF